MNRRRRFDVFYENHIGIGFRWLMNWDWRISFSLALPFVTFTIGFGEPKEIEPDPEEYRRKRL